MKIILRRTTDAFPSQWEGETSAGRFIYARHRHGSTTVGIGVDKGDAVNDSMSGMPFWSSEDGEEDGFMADAELIGLMAAAGHEVVITTPHMTMGDFGDMMHDFYAGLMALGNKNAPEVKS